MKRKFLDRSNWKRIIEKDFKLTYVKCDGFKGNVSAFYIGKVKMPLIKEVAGNTICLADDGYVWLQHLPKDENYSLTTMFDNSGNIVQWYFDITKQNYVKETDGIPFFDDLYLDVVVLPTSEIVLLDEDELKEALASNDITMEDYNLAYNKANEIINGIAKKTDILQAFSKRYLDYMNTQ